MQVWDFLCTVLEDQKKDGLNLRERNLLKMEQISFRFDPY